MKKISDTLQVLPVWMILFITLFSCETRREDDFITNVSVHIDAFSVNGVAGNIDNEADKITVTLPYGSNVTALSPQIAIPEGASVTPASGSILNFTQAIKFRVKNGNIYKDYEVSVKAQEPIISFKINGMDAAINHTSKTISLTVPQGTNLTTLQPVIETAPGVSITPASGSTIDFTNPVQFTVSNTNLTEMYTAKVSTPVSGPIIAFIGTASSRNALTNPDEIAASDWLFSQYSGAVYMSFADIPAASLNNIDVLWWHYDSATALPSEAVTPNITGKIKTYLNNGGNILLTSFASQYVDALGIVPAGKGPNNVFGDFLPNGFVDGSDWGISFVGNENHPVFEGLQTYETGKANLLKKNTFRLNHTAWWFLPDWGGYTNGAGWRSQTGGNNLASEAWDNALDGRVAIAEFPAGTANKTCIVISMGAYDWYNETSNGTPSAPNDFIDNIKTLTSNSLNYLTTH
ncbi:DUF4960 domain-containing protein [Chryseobacterium sp. NRRL B-14859]|uniref:DUF4960 domain-containing protein n=1 Tax=Chryseobacterium sp. NRRL B-14859 TaxID=1562763 RepID=UPI003394B4BE